MSQPDNLNHTNDVPITSIQGRSPALWGLLKRSFSKEECLLLEKLFLIAVELKANDELIPRQPGVTFNARLARVVQIASDAISLNLSLVIKCFMACCADINSFIQMSQENLPASLQNSIFSNLESDAEFTIAKCAALLDEIRHLHLSKLSNNKIQDIINKASYLNNTLDLESNNKFKVIYTTAINNARARLLTQ